jgi:hypothetical protein
LRRGTHRGFIEFNPSSCDHTDKNQANTSMGGEEGRRIVTFGWRRGETDRKLWLAKMVIEKNFKNIDQKKILYFFSEH